MTDDSNRIAPTRPHPKSNCNYAELLHWHLVAQGTRPPGANFRRWDYPEFRKAIFGGNSEEENSKRLLKNWLGGGPQPSRVNSELVIKALIGNDDQIGDDADRVKWKFDLNDARERCEGKDGLSNIWTPPDIVEQFLGDHSGLSVDGSAPINPATPADLPTNLAWAVGGMASRGERPPAEWVPHIKSARVGGGRWDTMEIVGDLWALEELDLSICKLQDYRPLSRLKNLRRVDLSHCAARDIAWLQNATGLVSLNLSGSAVSDIAALRYLPMIEGLDISNCNIQDISPISGLSALSILVMQKSFCPDKVRFNDISALSGLDRMDRLFLEGADVEDIASLAKCKELKHLNLSRTQVRDLTPLRNLTLLESLTLEHSKIDSIAALADLERLEHLNISYTQVKDLSPLAGKRKLKVLIAAFTSVSDVSCLRDTELFSLDLEDTAVKDVSALVEIATLAKLNLADTAVGDVSMLHKPGLSIELKSDRDFFGNGAG